MRTIDYTRLRSIYLLLPAFLLSGFFLNRLTGPTLEITAFALSEQQAKWSRFIGYGPDSYATQLSTFNQDGTLMLAQQSYQMVAIQTDTGETSWKKNSGYPLSNPASHYQTTFFIGTHEPKLLAVNANTGDLVWATQLPKPTLARVACDETHLVLKTISSEVMALDPKDGSVLWQYQHPSSEVSLTTSSAPQLTQDKVLVGFSDGQLVALDRNTGQRLWKHSVAKAKHGTELDKLIDIAGDPVIDHDSHTIYVSSYQGNLKALSLANGQTQWERPFSGYTPLQLGKHLYAVDSDHILYAFDPSNGNILWSQPVFNEYKTIKPDYQITGPVLTQDTSQLVIADYIGNLYWLSTNDGHIIGKASFRIASPILHPPLSQTDRVYAINRRGQMATWDITQHAPAVVTPATI